MTISLRTNLFRFDPDELPSVMQYRASREFLNGWQLLANHFGKPYLPTESLEEILSYLSGGPVWVNAQLLKNQQTPVIVALNPIEPDKLNRAINVWAQHILRKRRRANRTSSICSSPRALLLSMPLTSCTILDSPWWRTRSSRGCSRSNYRANRWSHLSC